MHRLLVVSVGGGVTTEHAVTCFTQCLCFTRQSATTLLITVTPIFIPWRAHLSQPTPATSTSSSTPSQVVTTHFTLTNTVYSGSTDKSVDREWVQQPWTYIITIVCFDLPGGVPSLSTQLLWEWLWIWKWRSCSPVWTAYRQLVFLHVETKHNGMVHLDESAPIHVNQ